jgi:hypothetical protein
MAFIVEDGSIVAGANAYVIVAEANAYFDARYITTWVGSELQKQAYIIRATQYLDATYTFKGQIVSSEQTLRWPRVGVTDRDGRALAGNIVPIMVKHAACELALVSISTDLVPIVQPEDRVASVRAGSAGVVFEAGSKDVGVRYTYVDRMLGDLTMSGGGMMSATTERGY